MRIIDGVYIVGGAEYNLSKGCNVYLIDTGGELLLVDIATFRRDEIGLLRLKLRLSYMETNH